MAGSTGAARSCALMAAYNARMNRACLDAARTLPAAALKAPRKGAFFDSIMGTLAHVVVCDTVWAQRFRNAGEPHAGLLAPVGRMPAPKSLRECPYEDLAELEAARAGLDEALLAWAGAVTDSDLEGELTYTRMAGGARPETLPLWALVQHFWNHQTHHRGQLSALLLEAGADVGVTDLLVDIRAREAAPP